MNTTPPTLHLSYCPTTKSISANFSKPLNRDLTFHEEEAMALIGKKFSEQYASLLYEAATKETFCWLKSLCQSIIDQVYCETGVKFDLDTAGIDNFLGAPRFSYPNWY